MAVYAIGDLQGCFYSFQNLLKALNFNKNKDELWLVGDLINRGYRSLEVLNWCYEHRSSIKAVLGNHDLHLLAIVSQENFLSSQDILQPVLKSKNLTKFVDWLFTLPLVHTNKNFLMVHAGLLPCWTSSEAKSISDQVSQALNKNPSEFFKTMYGDEPNFWDEQHNKEDLLRVAINAMTRMRALNKDGSMNFSFKGNLDQIPASLTPWYLFEVEQKRKEFLLSGHWSAIGIRSYEGGITLDSGCVWGGQLTAYNLTSNRITSIKADSRDLS